LGSLINNYSTTTYAPVSPIVQNPQLAIISHPVPFFKNLLATDINQYKYFVSDTVSKSISALYATNINSNKIVIKFNTIMTVPTVTVSLDGTSIGSFTPNNKGVLILYYNGSSWSTTKWSSMPKFSSTGSLTVSPAAFKKITVTQTSKTVNTQFSSITNTTYTNATTGDVNRLHVVEISPRLEIDLTDFVQSVDINKSLDSKGANIPISQINSNDASIILSGIPAVSGSNLVSIFSNQSNQSATILTNMLRKNIKFYINFNLKSYAQASNNSYNAPNTYIPGGIFYSDSWAENDINEVRVQCYDITRYLQAVPVADYVSNLKSMFEVITNILDTSGFTDYDIDSLYNVCNDKVIKSDLFYYYANSKDTTLIDALVKLLLPYQIACYIDEYGIMNFKSLSQLLSTKTSLITLNDSHVLQGGYSIDNKAKPGKISVRYTSPKIKQSLSLQNITSPGIKNSPSFIYATADDVVWQQQSLDSVGYNYLYSNMLEKSNKFDLNKNVQLDIFHTFSLNNNGYAAIENEIVSFDYKEYTISNSAGSVTVSVKNDIELASEINKFIKKYQTGLVVSDGTSSTDYDVTITPTGNITNVQRGLFGTPQSDHLIINTAISDKGLSEKVVSSSYTLSAGTNTTIANVNSSNTNLPSLKRINTSASTGNKTIIYPTSSTDQGYSTYSVSFDLPDQNVCSAGLFFNMASTTSTSGAYFVELIRYNQTDISTGSLYSPAKYRYLLVLYSAGGTVIAWSDITGIGNSIVGNFEKILVNANTTPVSYTTASDQFFKLKVVHYSSDGTDGEDTGEVFTAFLNNIEILDWQVPSTSTGILATGWKPKTKNSYTGISKKPLLTGYTSNVGTVFGFFSAITPITISGTTGISYPASSTTNPANLREIYACEKSLKERSVSYLYQDRQFLNGLIQNQNVFSDYKSYMMQTNPSAIGINFYDVQYTSPAAVNVDVLPIEYTWYYFPGTDIVSQNFYQKQLVDEYSIAYSTPINTGFRAKMAIANNSSHMVYLSKQSDQLNNFTIHLNLWTHELIAPSDPEILEYVVDPSNASEIVQLDSEWIQSKDAANKMLLTIEKALDGFSKDVSLSIYGNPLIQVGDVVTLTYSLAGLNQQKYVVHSISHSFSEGLDTKILLNMIDKGVTY
jgi:hypothetical protein